MKKIIETISEEYVSLMLSKIPYDGGDIYAYLDAPSGKRRTPIDRNKTIYLYTPVPERKERSVAEIHKEALMWEEKLEQIKKEEPQDARVDFLLTHMRSLRVRSEMLLGKEIKYDDMIKGLYDLTAPDYEEEIFDKALKELEEVLPGKGTLAERIANFKKKVTVPANRLAATMTGAVEAFHEMAIKNMDINQDSAPRLSFYSFGEHRKGLELDGYVYDWELDRINWEIVFSTDHAFTIDDIISFSCHEVEPGHLTFIGLRTKAAYENACPELAVVSQFSPSSAFVEGGARMGIDLCLPGEELYKFEKEVLFPLAGFDPNLIECLPAWHHYRKVMNYAKQQLDRKMWNREWTQAEGIAYMKKYQLAAPEECAYAVNHLAVDPGHFVAHDYSRDIIMRYVYNKAKTMPERWKMYKDLSMAHISMSAIEDETYELS
ncbi:MAG: hypothetical protein HFJ10_14070 [Lachnospiraceae bacterium]|jgi:hypothetical protein|nr:hypothetical protein [Lachnospiraceae bacterium]